MKSIFFILTLLISYTTVKADISPFLHIRNKMLESNILRKLSNYYYHISPIAERAISPQRAGIRVGVICENQLKGRIKYLLERIPPFGVYYKFIPDSSSKCDIYLVEHLFLDTIPSRQEPVIPFIPEDLKNFPNKGDMVKEWDKVMTEYIDYTSNIRMMCRFGLQTISRILQSLIFLPLLASIFYWRKYLVYLLVLYIVIGIWWIKINYQKDIPIEKLFTKRANFERDISLIVEKYIPENKITESPKIEKEKIKAAINYGLKSSKLYLKIYALRLAGFFKIPIDSYYLQKYYQSTILNLRYTTYYLLGRISTQQSKLMLLQRIKKPPTLYEKFYLVEAILNCNMSYQDVFREKR